MSPTPIKKGDRVKIIEPAHAYCGMEGVVLDYAKHLDQATQSRLVIVRIDAKVELTISVQYVVRAAEQGDLFDRPMLDQALERAERSTMPQAYAIPEPAPQPTVAEAAADRDRGMAVSAANQGPAWKELALEAVQAFCEEHEYFHVDEFWSWAAERGFDSGPSPRGLGAVIQRASRGGIIEKTGRGAPSVRSNLTDKPVWRSRTFQGRRTGLFRDTRIEEISGRVQ